MKTINEIITARFRHPLTKLEGKWIEEIAKEYASQAIDRCEKEVPTNWLDSMLTGKNAVIKHAPYNCNDIENILREVKQRVKRVKQDLK